MYTKGKGRGKQLRWERLHCVITTTTNSWCLHSVRETDPNIYTAHIKTDVLSTGWSEWKGEMALSCTAKQNDITQVQNATIKSFFLRHISARFLSKYVSLPFPQSIFLWSYFCLFQRKTITTKRIKHILSPSLF